MMGRMLVNTCKEAAFCKACVQYRLDLVAVVHVPLLPTACGRGWRKLRPEVAISVGLGWRLRSASPGGFDRPPVAKTSAHAGLCDISRVRASCGLPNRFLFSVLMPQ